ncbi:hypothetical protein DPMN_145386 [Dreissena polymorpha]|uniref:Uncharacterized protein n=1 Tax=Dreissena polymorpha TaxID=45954 RepID=A0A9D4F8H7_DREPO|nr:hypothetical protein DPMN_145386 [Dreissena polymorpha]
MKSAKALPDTKKPDGRKDGLKDGRTDNAKIISLAYGGDNKSAECPMYALCKQDYGSVRPHPCIDLYNKRKPVTLLESPPLKRQSKSQKCSWQVAGRQHLVDDQYLDVTLYVRPITPPSYKNKLLIKGLNPKTGFHAKAGITLCNVTVVQEIEISHEFNQTIAPRGQ